MENDDCIAIKIWCTICSVKKKNTILQMCFCSSDNCCGGCCWWLFAEARLEIVLQWSATVAGRCLPFVHPRESNLRHLLIKLPAGRCRPPDTTNATGCSKRVVCDLLFLVRAKRREWGFMIPYIPCIIMIIPATHPATHPARHNPLLGLQLCLHRAWAIKGAGQIRPKQGSWWGI